LIPAFGLFTGDQSGLDAQQLGNFIAKCITNGFDAEDLIEETTTSDEKGTSGPGTECTGGHIRVVVVVDRSTDLGVGRVLYASHQRSACALRRDNKFETYDHD
jgi:hypothetical protein